MKKTLLYLLLATGGLVNAQNITIPDSTFKTKLLNASTTNNIAKGANGNSIVVDVNNDDEIQQAEALLVYKLTIIESQIATLQGIEAFTNLTSLSVGSNNLTTLDVSPLTNLEYLNVSDNDLTQLNISGTNLSSLSCWKNQLTTLDLSQVNLTHLECGQNLFTVLDVSSQTNLQGFYAYSCPNLVEVYMKNGHVDPFNGETVGNCPNLEIICADEGEIELIIETFEQMQEWGMNMSAFVTSYCSFEPGGMYNTIAGTVSFDTNNNGCESAEALQGFIKMNISGSAIDGASFTNSTGNYNFYIQAPGAYTVTPEFDSALFTVTPASATVAIADINNTTSTNNFCITPNGTHPDVEVILTPMSAARPGFNAYYKVVYVNKGNQTLSGSVTVNFDDANTDFVEAQPTETTFTAGQLTWSYTGLLPFESRSTEFVVNVNSPQEDPAVNIGDILNFSVTATPITGDDTPADNTFNFSHTVTGSFDPNDITCLEGETAAPDTIGDYLHYNINFENTGNEAATFIVVKDIIDETQYDLNTLKILNTSHEMQTRIDGNTVEFYFDDINLGANEKGNIVFKIKTLNSLQVNDDVTQKADIFFDYNHPIETNEATTTFAALSTGSFTLDASVKVYPNPSDGIVNVLADNQISLVELYDMQGRLLQRAIINEVEAKLDVSQRAAGIYFIKTRTANGSNVQKIVKE